MFYRRNSDESIRKLERQYLTEPTESLRSVINQARKRAHKKLLPPSYRLFLFNKEAYPPEGAWQIQSQVGDLIISSASALHDGWWGIDHGAWPVIPSPEKSPEDFISLGNHLVSVQFPAALPKPKQRQVVQAHLEVVGFIETQGLEAVPSSYHRWGDFTQGHHCDFSMYDFSNHVLELYVTCSYCDEPDRLYCSEHDVAVCIHHGTHCEEVECTNIECPICAPKCDVCRQPACSFHIRECTCGCMACTNANVWCWDFCAVCGDRICRKHAKVIDDEWYCLTCEVV